MNINFGFRKRACGNQGKDHFIDEEYPHRYKIDMGVQTGSKMGTQTTNGESRKKTPPRRYSHQAIVNASK
jgi:hypothetical protein